jgi:hypothetical protein
MDKKHKIIRIGTILTGSILIIVVLVILLISPITKHLIEKYDEKYTGRQITMDWVYVNPFTGYIHFSNLKIHEFNSDSLFIKAKSVNINISLHKLLSKTLELSTVELNQPDIMVDKIKKKFNFSDIILKLTPKDKNHIPKNSKSSNLKVSILGMKIHNGIIHYRDRSVPINYFIKNVNLECPGKRWDSDSIDVKYAFLSGTRTGKMNGIFSMNVRNLNYRIEVVAHKFDLKVLDPYIRDLKNYGNLSAYLETNLKAKGNFRDVNDVTFTGMLAIHNFHVGIRPDIDYGSFEKLQFAIYQLSPKNKKYLFDSVSLTHPYFKYERYDHFDNILQMFGKVKGNQMVSPGSPANFNLIITIGNYISQLSKNFFHSDYKVNRLALYQGNFHYHDYTLGERFALQVEPVTIISDSIDKNQDRVFISLKSGLNPSGNITLSLSINPKDSGDFDLNYNIKRVPATLFNPYLISFTSFPLNKGIIELNGVWNVRNGIIKSRNRLEIIDPHVAKRIRNKDTKWLPMWLVMAIIRDRGNVIDYQIPITGNLKKPTFHIKDIVFNALENVIVKPATTPYRIHVKNVEADIEKSLSMKWEMHQDNLDGKQKQFVKGMVDFLLKNPNASIVVHPNLYLDKESEYIVLFEAKKKFFISLHHQQALSLDNIDSTLIDEMSIRDKSFTTYLNNQTQGKILFTVQEKSELLIGRKSLNSKLLHLSKEREHAFMENFREKGVEKQVRFASVEAVIPFNGYSFYKISYKGEFPVQLIKAYQKLNELNNEDPRKEYKKDRKKTAKSQ